MIVKRLLLAACIGATACTSVRTPDARFDAIRAKLQQATEKNEVASISVAVAIDGKLVWAEAFGYADRRKAIRATTRTQYPIASITKPITATGVMLLAERGAIDIDRPAVAYLGERSIRGYAADASEATIRRLLLHRSGLAEHNQYYYGEAIANRPPIEETLRKYAMVAYPPDRKYRYSNIGYGALEALIARVSGRSYERFLHDEVFAPLAMTRTSVGPLPDAATLHLPDMPLPRYDFASRGSGWVFSTPEDLVRFANAQLGLTKHALSAASARRIIDERHTTGTPGGRYGTDWWCGFGFCGRDESAYGFAWYGHDGGMPGASSRMKIVPSRRIVAVALSNSRQQLTYDIVDEILDVLLPEYAEKRRADPAFQRTSPQEVRFPAELHGTWRGEVIGTTRREPLSITIAATSIDMRVGDQQQCKLAELRFAGDSLGGSCTTGLPLELPADAKYEARLDVDRRGDALVGTLSGYTPPPLFHFFLPAAVSLRKVE